MAFRTGRLTSQAGVTTSQTPCALWHPFATYLLDIHLLIQYHSCSTLSGVTSATCQRWLPNQTNRLLPSVRHVPGNISQPPPTPGMNPHPQRETNQQPTSPLHDSSNHPTLPPRRSSPTSHRFDATLPTKAARPWASSSASWSSASSSTRTARLAWCAG